VIATRDILADIPAERLPEVWCALNKFEPHPLVQPWPANWKEMTVTAKYNFLGPWMSAILRAVGLRECLREWNRESMPGEVFDHWWHAHYD